MFLRNLKSIIYIILLFIILSVILPFYSYAFSEDSIYVWSTNSSSVSTSISPSESEQNSDNLENSSR